MKQEKGKKSFASLWPRPSRTRPECWTNDASCVQWYSLGRTPRSAPRAPLPSPFSFRVFHRGFSRFRPKLYESIQHRRELNKSLAGIKWDPGDDGGTHLFSLGLAGVAGKAVSACRIILYPMPHSVISAPIADSQPLPLCPTFRQSRCQIGFHAFPSLIGLSSCGARGRRRDGTPQAVAQAAHSDGHGDVEST